MLLALNIDVVVPFIENALGFQFLAKDVYYITDLPSDLQLRDVLTIGLVSLVLSLRGHAVSELARLAHQAGGGAAL